MADRPDEPDTSTEPEAVALDRGLAAAFGPAPPPEPAAGPSPEPGTAAGATATVAEPGDDRSLADPGVTPARTATASAGPGGRPQASARAGPRPLTEGPGTRIGPYRLLELIGEGGMGVVFRAEQQRPVRRTVALKVIKPGMDTDAVIARFEAERQALALMDHPHIARVLDAGATDAGRPYFVMELVDGAPITEYCDRCRLTPRERLELFIPVCQAIQHAHQKGVIHRDIKPSNVLVLQVDGKPMPKVIDFGIAKAIDQRLTERTLFTQLGAIVGTPEYMSPEQAEMGGVDIDTRSDVYSLGVLLYELLTGSTPLDRATLRQAAFAEMLRRIREEEPPKPSTRLSSDERLPALSAERGVEPSRLARLVRGDLDWVVMRALEKDRGRRYETASGLAADVRRILEGDPVEAGPPSAAYRLRRYAGKHRGLLATAAAFAGLLVLGTVVSTWQAVRATRAERAAVAQRDRAERNLGFARQVVDEMYTQVAEKLDDQTQMDAYQREILEKALRFYEQFALPQSRDPQFRLEAARAGLRAGGIRARLGQTAAAEQAERQALGILSGLVSERHAEPAYRDALAQAHRELGVVLRDQERWDESEGEIQAAASAWEVLARERPDLAEYRSNLADAHGRLGDQYQFQARDQEAVAAFRRALDIADRLAREHPEVTAYQESLASILRAFARLKSNRLHDRPGATASFRRAVAIMEQLARDHPETTKYQLALGLYLGNLAQNLAVNKNFSEAEERARRAVAILEKLAADHPQDLKIAAALAEVYLRMHIVLSDRGEDASAVEWTGRQIQMLRLLARRDPHNLSVGRRQLWEALAQRGEAWMRLGRLAEALADFKEAVELAQGSKDEEVFRLFHALTRARLGDPSELALLGDRVRESVRAHAGKDSEGAAYFWMLYYDAACIHAALAQLALQDRGRSPAERQRLADRDLERALEILDRAGATGEFKDSIHPGEVRREALLAPLRSHPRFQVLMMDSAFPDDPFRP
jgi:serine/threonine protein kinase